MDNFVAWATHRAGGGAMADYRVYCLDGAGNIALADWIEADTDDEALAKARELRPNAQKCEIWRKDRLIAKLSASGRLESPISDDSLLQARQPPPVEF